MIRKRGSKWVARVGDGPLRTFDRKADAEEYESQQRRDRSRARAGMEVEQGAITYDGLCELYLANFTGKSSAWTEAMLVHSRTKFGRSLVRQLRPEVIGAWLHGLQLSPKTKTHILERMRAVLTKGVEWGYLSRSPARPSAVSSPGSARVEDIMPFESWAEVRAVAAECGKHARLVQLACATGARVPSELFALTWGDIIPATSIRIRGTKTKNADRVVPLTMLALEALHGLPRGLPHVPVFSMSSYMAWRKHQWPRALDNAGLARRPPYQMRHTFATLALKAGVPIDNVSKAMGHSSIEITMRYYAKYLPATMAAAFARMNDLLEGDEHEAVTSRDAS